ncbi:MBL fold metallo-hydrolase [Methanobacterium oryzae]|uniref:MBL fold metallo-hydrolase n=1 Tax=Methanobacterium oryzae TaxID=69540 RepID=UPI003D229D7E
MKLRILYDNNARNGFKEGWGFSCLIETSEEKILFDTGWNGNILLHNMKIAGVNPEEIDKIVISHSHWDHIGGLNHILNCAKEPEVYIPKSIPVNLKNEIKNYADIIEVSEAQKICENVWTTGELGDKIKEQSLLLKTEKGNIILTGCAHPGIESIIEKSMRFGDVYAVIGGFHDSDIELLNEIPIIVPCHCTEKIEEIKKMSESYKTCFAGYSSNIKDL